MIIIMKMTIVKRLLATSSGAGTNLKVGVGAHVRRKTPEKFILSCPSTFLAVQVQAICKSWGTCLSVPYGVGATDDKWLIRNRILSHATYHQTVENFKQ